MTDSELMALIRQGNTDAFDELVRAYEKRVVNIAYSMLSDREDALDASQEVFVKIYKNIGAFRGESTISTWIFRITQNVCKDFLRRRKGAVKSLDQEEEDEPKQEIADETLSPEKISERNEKNAAVRRAIASLDENQRIVITLYDLEGMSYDEIAAIVKCPVGTVKSRLYRAREALRKKLSENMELFL